MKSASSSGPIGWLSPTLAPVSMSSAVPRPSSYARIASARNGIRIRLTMKPGRSADTMTCLPSSAARSRTAASVASSVAAPRISSISGITGTGLKKCMPTNRSRRASPTAAASRSMEIEDVLEAKTRGRGRDRVEVRPQPGLHVEVLEHGLDDEVGIGGGGEVVGGAEAGERRVAVVGGQLALGDRPLEVAGDPVPAGVGAREVGLVERDLLADGGMDLGDAVAHEPGAGDEHPLDAHR